MITLASLDGSDFPSALNPTFTQPSSESPSSAHRSLLEVIEGEQVIPTQ